MGVFSTELCTLWVLPDLTTADRSELVPGLRRSSVRNIYAGLSTNHMLTLITDAGRSEAEAVVKLFEAQVKCLEVYNCDFCVVVRRLESAVAYQLI